MAPPQTTLKQKCTIAKQLDGTQRFEILSNVDYVRAGDLPHGDVFVNEIVQSNNPKSDKFKRVAQLADLTSLPRGRTKALEQGKTLYLASTNVITYDAVAVAVTAKKVVQARIDDLITQWKDYTQRFLVPDEFELPLVAPSIVKAAKDAYLLAKTARIEKDAALVTAQAGYDAKSLLATRAGADLTAAISRQSSCSQIQALMASVILGENTFRTAAQVFAGVATGPSDALTAFNAARTAETRDGQAMLAALSTLINTECSNETTAVTSAAAVKAQSDADLAAAQTTLTVAQAEATKAQDDEDAALTAVLEVCPDFEG